MGAEMDLNKKSCATGCPAILYSEFPALNTFLIFTSFKDQKLWAKSPPKSVICAINALH